MNNVYHPESHVLRYCTRCVRWYHIRCLRRRGTVASMRMAAQTNGTPWWTVWTPPANIPANVAVVLVRLVTLPIQRGHRRGPPGTHPLLSFERFSTTLRRLVQADDAPLPATSAQAEALIQQLLEISVADPNESTLCEAAAAIRWLGRVPLDHRIIYSCPRRETHSL